MLNLILVEAALELVPKRILRHPSVRRNAKRRGKSPEETLLNRSIHHSAMSRLENSEKRGRPDIANVCLLETQGSPLNKVGKLKTFIHTNIGICIDVNPEVRLPRDCNRFGSLMEQLLLNGRVPIDSDVPLLSSSTKSLSDLKQEIKPSLTIALTSHGEQTSLEILCKELALEDNPTVLLGAYPHGPLNEETLNIADRQVSIHPKSLEAWVIVSRLIYEYEKAAEIMV